MKKWSSFEGIEPKPIGKNKNMFDNNIYTFDIETTSFFIVNNKQVPAKDYEKLTDKQKENAIPCSIMYEWSFGINNEIYYGRTWEELRIFLHIIASQIPIKKYLFIHNFTFEFQFLRSQFEFQEVFARTKRKVMKAVLSEFNFEVRCTYFLSNASLKQLPKLYKLNVKKMVGDLDYNLIRTPITKLTEKELHYCKNDCLVLYEYIKRELETYETVKKIPKTSTGKVRRELRERTQKDYKYRNKVRKSINTNPIIFNRLQECFMRRLYSRELYLHR